MTIEFILTFNNHGQITCQYPFINEVLKDRETLFEFAIEMLDEDLKKDLVKVSCCVIKKGDSEFIEPDWYSACNGKLWIKEGNLI